MSIYFSLFYFYVFVYKYISPVYDGMNFIVLSYSIQFLEIQTMDYYFLKCSRSLRGIKKLEITRLLGLFFILKPRKWSEVEWNEPGINSRYSILKVWFTGYKDRS
jgi:hypothetical protein